MTADRFSKDAQRYLDGEPHGEVAEAERRAADRLSRGALVYGARLSPPGSSLEDVVMAAILRQPAPRRSAWAWALEPRTVRVRPAWGLLAAAAVVALLALPRFGLLARWRTGGGAAAGAGGTAASAPRGDTVYVRFELAAPDAHQVTLAGEFNGWRTEALALTRGNGGVWSVTIPLVVGEHQYQFVVDGARWVSDPKADVLVQDGFGGTNSVIVVGPKGVVRT